MRFLADESCDFAVVRALRSQGHDVTAISEDMPSVPDEAVAAHAVSQERILLTEDKDFGQLVFATAAKSPGVILVRFPASARSSLARTICLLIDENGGRLSGCFTVVKPGRVRIAKQPG